ncbi:hypothetical protein [Actinomadura rudentiformis]|uniref:Lipoprotein n=1 Tax=Actinomadura rudentiformis TaxID=359158 RepID=A0A6H9YUZ8_9ACTN|nr:hypothetical protein [Actinomadura rudentiformis]KAB2350899.1 hypothetical protein F8566_08050 [Actinomadura rudentiformis]
MHPRTTVAAVVCVALLAAGCSDRARQSDPWTSAGVAEPRLRTGPGNSLAVEAQTDLPLDDEANQAGFNRRAAKIAWRTHPGRVDSMNVAISDESGHSHTRAWRRADLEAAFGPRLAGLDEGRDPKPRERPARGDGPYRDNDARDLRQSLAITGEVLRRTSQEIFGRGRAPVEGGREECMGGMLGIDPNGKHRASSRLLAPLPGGTHEIVPLTRLVTYWSRLGLDVDTSGLYSGNDDLVSAALSGAGRLSAGVKAPYGQRERSIELVAHTDCF